MSQTPGNLLGGGSTRRPDAAEHTVTTRVEEFPKASRVMRSSRRVLLCYPGPIGMAAQGVSS